MCFPFPIMVCGHIFINILIIIFPSIYMYLTEQIFEPLIKLEKVILFLFILKYITY